MTNRPKIPRHIELDLLVECRFRCACDCEPVSLEKAHIIPWCETKDHSFKNLIVLCANCHTRSHAEKWPESQLRKFKNEPCAIQRDRLPPITGEQKAMVDLILSAHVDSMNEKERLRLAMMTAAYVGVSFKEVSIISVASSNSSLVRLEMPREAAERLIQGFQAEDPRLVSFLDDFACVEVSKGDEEQAFPNFGLDSGVKLIETARPTPAERPPVTNVKEEGLESLIVSAMTNFGWLAGENSDYEREYAVDLRRLTEFIASTQEETAAGLD